MERAFLYAILMCLVSPTFADEPLSRPTTVTACSASGEFCAISDPVMQETIIHRRGDISPLWKIPGWYRWILVNNDGHRVIIGYPGLNLIPKDAKLDMQVLRIYGPSGLVKSLALSELYRSKSQLSETVSHYDWERSVSLDGDGHLVVEREDGSKVAFDPNTGSHL